jgi:hypothetical protein
MLGSSHIRHAESRLSAGPYRATTSRILESFSNVDGNNFGEWTGCDRWSTGTTPKMGRRSHFHRSGDGAIANIALPAIAADLHAGAADVIWVVNVYQIAMVATLLPLAALGEVIGHHRIYLGGLLLFTLASLLCACAGSLPSLLTARALQGLGAGGIMSVNTALVRFVLSGRLQGRGFGHNALVVATAFSEVW